MIASSVGFMKGLSGIFPLCHPFFVYRVFVPYSTRCRCAPFGLLGTTVADNPSSKYFARIDRLKSPGLPFDFGFFETGAFLFARRLVFCAVSFTNCIKARLVFASKRPIFLIVSPWPSIFIVILV